MISTVCHSCKGTGKKYRKKCEHCDGTGILQIDVYDCTNVEQITSELDMEIPNDDDPFDS